MLYSHSTLKKSSSKTSLKVQNYHEIPSQMSICKLLFGNSMEPFSLYCTSHKNKGLMIFSNNLIQECHVKKLTKTNSHKIMMHCQSRNLKAFNALLKRDKKLFKYITQSTVRKTLSLQKVQIEIKKKVCQVQG